MLRHNAVLQLEYVPHAYTHAAKQPPTTRSLALSSPLAASFLPVRAQPRKTVTKAWVADHDSTRSLSHGHRSPAPPPFIAAVDLSLLGPLAPVLASRLCSRKRSCDESLPELIPLTLCSCAYTPSRIRDKATDAKRNPCSHTHAQFTLRQRYSAARNRTEPLSKLGTFACSHQSCMCFCVDVFCSHTFTWKEPDRA